MKKIYLRISFCVLFTISILLFSCENNSSEECTTCQTQDYTLSKVSVFNSNLMLKKFDEENSTFHLLHNSINIKDLKKSIESFKLKNNFELDSNKLVAICLITNNLPIKNTNDYSINENDINGVLLYTLNNKNNLNIRFLNKSGNLFSENSIFNIEIGFISSNHIYDFTNLFFDEKEKSVFLLVDKSYSINENISNKKLNSTLDEFYLNLKNINRTVDPKTCGRGCTKNNGYECALKNNGDYFCKEDDNCPEEESEQTLRNNNILTYDYEQIADDLHYFRGNYLKAYNGGQKIIDDYYELGRNLPLSFYSIQNCDDLFKILSNDLLPIVNNLSENPTAESILIDSQLKIKLINYLTLIKGEYTDQNSKNKIDNLINKINFFSNKTNNYITNNLNLY